MQEMSRLTKQAFSSVWKDNKCRAQAFVAEERVGRVVDNREKTELLFCLASVFVNENAYWTGEGENNIGTRDLKSKKNWKTDLLQMRPTVLD